MELFTAQDFQVFEIASFARRMEAIRGRVRPKLAAIGDALAPDLAGLVDRPVYAHVAKHARRTVNPPDDTWVALGPDRRGYKKDIHFKVVVSRHCVRLLFEVGPEYYAKDEWALGWRREVGNLAGSFPARPRLGWFRNEHDEEPQKPLSGKVEELKALSQALGGREGQLVIGRRLGEAEILSMTEARFRRAALGTFRSLAPLFSIHELRRAS